MVDTPTTNELVEPLVLTDQQVAALLSVPCGSVRYMHRVGVLRGVKIGGHLRWRRQDVRDFVQNMTPQNEG